MNKQYYFITYWCYNYADGTSGFYNDVIDVHPFEWLERTEGIQASNHVERYVLVRYKEINKIWFDRLKDKIN